MEVDWSDLSKDLLFSIAARTEHLFEYIRFGAVCKSWRSAITVNPRPLHLRFPLLLLSKITGNGHNRALYNSNLYNPFKRKLHSIELLDINRCIGSSSDGFVCMIDVNLDICLFNPISNAVVLLPPLRTDYSSDGSFEYVLKAVLSAKPTDPNCIIALLCETDDYHMVYYCRPGDAWWTLIKTSLEFVTDAVFFNENLYVVNSYAERVAAIDLHKGREMTMATGPDGFLDWTDNFRYLVAGPSGPLLVVRHLKNLCETRGFELFRLDGTLKKWVETKSLDEGMVFLGRNTSFWLSSSNLKECKGNSIYFMDNNRDLGIFNLEDGSFGSICGLDKKLLCYNYEWVVPIS